MLCDFLVILYHSYIRKACLEVFDVYIQGIDLHSEQERHTYAIILTTYES